MTRKCDFQGLNGIFDNMQCFSGDLMVETAEGPKKMSELKMGDEVLSIEENMVHSLFFLNLIGKWSLKNEV